jgi:small subunit ribosomal protein S8
MYKQGFIRGFSYNTKKILVFLKYSEVLVPVIKNIKTLSSSGKNVRISYKAIASSLKNKGVFFISTPKGLVTSDRMPLSFRAGGEVFCKVI